MPTTELLRSWKVLGFTDNIHQLSHIAIQRECKAYFLCYGKDIGQAGLLRVFGLPENLGKTRCSGCEVEAWRGFDFVSFYNRTFQVAGYLLDLAGFDVTISHKYSSQILTLIR